MAIKMPDLYLICIGSPHYTEVGAISFAVAPLGFLAFGFTGITLASHDLGASRCAMTT
jgi:hypothetical protein